MARLHCTATANDERFAQADFNERFYIEIHCFFQAKAAWLGLLCVALCLGGVASRAGE